MNILMFLIALALMLFLTDDRRRGFEKAPVIKKPKKRALNFSTNPRAEKSVEV